MTAAPGEKELPQSTLQLSSGGGYAKSAGYQIVFSLGDPATFIGTTKSSKYQLKSSLFESSGSMK